MKKRNHRSKSIIETDVLNKDMRELLAEIEYRFPSLLGDNLVGIYVHGSLVMGSFNPDVSDVDFLVVVKEPLKLAEKKDLVSLSLELTKKAPKKGIEFSICTLGQVQDFKYPTPFEFHFGNDLREKYQKDEIDLEKQKYDYDLAAHITIIKERGYCLYGQPIEKVFPEVPRRYYLDSIVRDSKWSINNILPGPEEGKVGVPVYGVLNLCRVLAYIEDELILSKLEGGRWGLNNLPAKYKPLIQEALRKYIKRGSADKVDAALLLDFAQFGKRRIDNLLEIS